MKAIKHSKQRDSIKTCLMGRRDHPTADAVYMSIREEFPNISLGTVYRNLNLLVELGEIQKLTCGYHFVCRHCGAVSDLEMDTFPGLNESAQEHCDGRIDTHTTYFYGLCKKCLTNTFC